LKFDTFACICEDEEDEEEGIVSGTTTESGEEGEVQGTTTEDVEEDDNEEKGLESLMLADIGSVLEFFGCLPWWLILILALYPLFKLLEKRDNIKKALGEWEKRELKRKQKVWFSWFSFLVILALILYWIGYWCIPWWLLVVLILFSLTLRFLFSEEKKKRE
jgi:hypothetical protein